MSFPREVEVAQVVHSLGTGRRRESIDAIARDGGLGERMAEWALESTIAAYTPAAIQRASDGRYRGRSVAVLLAETVPVASLRAILLPHLGLAREIVVRPPRNSQAFTRLVADELRRQSPMVAITVDDATGSAFVASLRARGVDHLIAFGADETLDTIVATAPEGVTVEGHGHGFGIAIVSQRALLGASAAIALARDVAAYEQRGCLSPQCVFVHDLDAKPSAEALHQGLVAIANTWPAPEIPADAALSLHSWAGAIGAASSAVYRAAPTTSVFAGSDHVVAALEGTRLASSPGHRRIAVVPFTDAAALEKVLAPHARHLTVVAIDANAPSIELPAHVRRVELGAMQTPPLDGWEDPRPATITRR